MSTLTRTPVRAQAGQRDRLRLWISLESSNGKPFSLNAQSERLVCLVGCAEYEQHGM